MASPDVHIVSFAVPYPATYGGAIDVFNRVKALHKEGVKVHLHCFIYGQFSPHNALNEITSSVNYYPRISWPAILSPGMPYIVASRQNPKLLETLQKDNAPVLFEGIHTTGFIDELNGRKKLLRAHNIEHKYYGNLAKDSQRFQYLFFQRESLALERYEGSHACSFDRVFAISPDDTKWYEQKGASVDFVPVFHGIEKMNVSQGRGSYILYHGDLSIESNQKAVLELLKGQVLDKYPFVVAGKSGDRTFEEKLTKYPNLKREVDVSEDKMQSLLCDAQIVIIHSRHSSGMKVKLFPALYNSRFIVCNEYSITNTGVDNALHVYRDNNELGSLLSKCWEPDVSDEMIRNREEALKILPSDKEKATAIINQL
jgi:hypothetical protein